MTIIFGSEEAQRILVVLQAKQAEVEPDEDQCPRCEWSTYLDDEYENCIVSNHHTGIGCQMNSGGI